jgi:hypothetical protein
MNVPSHIAEYTRLLLPNTVRELSKPIYLLVGGINTSNDTKTKRKHASFEAMLYDPVNLERAILTAPIHHTFLGVDDGAIILTRNFVAQSVALPAEISVGKHAAGIAADSRRRVIAIGNDATYRVYTA